ncbi:MAG: DNA-deoxyinosine glycosylase [Planctomycetota bacterium]|nr:MAG: DNA-deoxyinosine glycosylase [Planctomycetota bacterium]
MSRVQSFPPLSAPDARVLILGSMPGVASLQAGQYYAHPRNTFWRIMGTICGFDPAASYPQRVDALRAARVAVWDVLATCTRPGSGDAAIDPLSVTVQPFEVFLNEHPQVSDIYFNGSTAQTLFHRHVWNQLPSTLRDRLQLHRLPSTSPAHAALRWEQKRAAWQVIAAHTGG